MSAAASKYIPWTFIPSPNIVWVFPLPVCPYAKHDTLAPSKAQSTKGLIEVKYIWDKNKITC